MWKETKFEAFVAAQEIVDYRVYGVEFTIKLSMKEIRNKKFSKILAKYVNEQKAVIEGEYAYIIPDYDEYHSPPSMRMLRKGKLLQCAEQKSFVTMINHAQLIAKKTTGQTPKLQYYYQITQDLVKKYQCIHVIAALIDEKLAEIEENTGNIYIAHNYQQKLNEDSKIQSDLGGFRQLLGETSNIKALIEIIEQCTLKNGKMVIEKDAIIDADLNTEFMCLCDIGIAIDNGSEFELEVKLASWLLELVSNTSDRISFTGMYS